jgi:hypothetical protein
MCCQNGNFLTEEWNMNSRQAFEAKLMLIQFLRYGLLKKPERVNKRGQTA